MTFETVETNIGYLSAGRHAFIVKEIVFITPQSVRLTGEMLSENRSTLRNGSMIFEGVIHFQVSSDVVYNTLDGIPYNGTFVEIKDSTLLKNIKETGQYPGEYHHFYVCSYDHVFEIVAKNLL